MTTSSSATTSGKATTEKNTDEPNRRERTSESPMTYSISSTTHQSTSSGEILETDGATGTLSADYEIKSSTAESETTGINGQHSVSGTRESTIETSFGKTAALLETSESTVLDGSSIKPTESTTSTIGRSSTLFRSSVGLAMSSSTTDILPETETESTVVGTQTSPSSTIATESLVTGDKIATTKFQGLTSETAKLSSVSPLRVTSTETSITETSKIPVSNIHTTNGLVPENTMSKETTTKEESTTAITTDEDHTSKIQPSPQESTLEPMPTTPEMTTRQLVTTSLNPTSESTQTATGWVSPEATRNTTVNEAEVTSSNILPESSVTTERTNRETTPLDTLSTISTSGNEFTVEATGGTSAAIKTSEQSFVKQTSGTPNDELSTAGFEITNTHAKMNSPETTVDHVLSSRTANPTPHSISETEETTLTGTTFKRTSAPYIVNTPTSTVLGTEPTTKFLTTSRTPGLTTERKNVSTIDVPAHDSTTLEATSKMFTTKMSGMSPIVETLTTPSNTILSSDSDSISTTTTTTQERKSTINPETAISQETTLSSTITSHPTTTIPIDTTSNNSKDRVSELDTTRSFLTNGILQTMTALETVAIESSETPGATVTKAGNVNTESTSRGTVNTPRFGASTSTNEIASTLVTTSSEVPRVQAETTKGFTTEATSTVQVTPFRTSIEVSSVPSTVTTYFSSGTGPDVDITKSFSNDAVFKTSTRGTTSHNYIGTESHRSSGSTGSNTDSAQSGSTHQKTPTITPLKSTMEPASTSVIESTEVTNALELTTKITHRALPSTDEITSKSSTESPTWISSTISSTSGPEETSLESTPAVVSGSATSTTQSEMMTIKIHSSSGLDVNLNTKSTGNPTETSIGKETMTTTRAFIPKATSGRTNPLLSSDKTTTQDIASSVNDYTPDITYETTGSLLSKTTLNNQGTLSTPVNTILPSESEGTTIVDTSSTSGKTTGEKMTPSPTESRSEASFRTRGTTVLETKSVQVTEKRVETTPKNTTFQASFQTTESPVMSGTPEMTTAQESTSWKTYSSTESEFENDASTSNMITSPIVTSYAASSRSDSKISILTTPEMSGTQQPQMTTARASSEAFFETTNVMGTGQADVETTTAYGTSVGQTSLGVASESTPSSGKESSTGVGVTSQSTELPIWQSTANEMNTHTTTSQNTLGLSSDKSASKDSETTIKATSMSSLDMTSTAQTAIASKMTSIQQLKETTPEYESTSGTKGSTLSETSTAQTHITSGGVSATTHVPANPTETTQELTSELTGMNVVLSHY